MNSKVFFADVTRLEEQVKDYVYRIIEEEDLDIYALINDYVRFLDINKLTEKDLDINDFILSQVY